MLTHDILCEVASVSGRNELFSLMLISRDLQLHCAKYVLRDNVYLNTTRGFASFILFMGRNQSRRWRYLRSLSFGENRIDSDVAGALGKVISGASNLEILHFKHAEIVLGSHPQLGLGLAAVSTIKYAVLQRVGQHACRMLEAMFWPLETAVLDQDIVGQDDSLERLHPAVLLKNSRKTLQLLRYNRWTAYDSRLPEYPIYPALHSLDFADAWLPPASQWSLAYPNLKHLDVCSLDADYHGMDLATATRVTNLQEHAEFGCWPALEHFTGSVLELYALGLPCRILDVDIIVSSTTVESLEPALSVARPRRLTIRVWQHELYEGRTPELELPSYLRIPGLAEVKSLTLEIDAGGPVPTANMDAFLVSSLSFDDCTPRLLKSR